ncbi:MAG: hypothetical protein WC491_08105 [Candidatus Omnitrophota bacterium]|jgi:hypothetical protein
MTDTAYYVEVAERGETDTRRLFLDYNAALNNYENEISDCYHKSYSSWTIRLINARRNILIRVTDLPGSYKVGTEKVS